MAELKPCPFCGNKHPWMQTETDTDGFGFFLYVKCGICNAQSGKQYVSRGNDCPQTRQEVRDTWNQRTAFGVEAYVRPQECAASGAGHSDGTHGPGGATQCAYCGQAPTAGVGVVPDWSRARTNEKGEWIVPGIPGPEGYAEPSDEQVLSIWQKHARMGPATAKELLGFGRELLATYGVAIPLKDQS